ncbi:MAG: exodeoxyribonuclease VII large subunit, partial [Gammaproteobacteria bacterium]|nr:exodeoxyribonuclease VII large subunit [Gammaproteobacteria bacterium]
MLTPDPNRTIYSVSDLNRDVKTLLNQAFPLMWIQGEISNLTVPSSGHWYFTLKDNKAQIRGAMFKQRNRHLKIAPKNGMEVMVRAKVSLYEPRGDYQLIVEDMEEAGAGALQREFEVLKNRLQAEGL